MTATMTLTVTSISDLLTSKVSNRQYVAIRGEGKDSVCLFDDHIEALHSLFTVGSTVTVHGEVIKGVFNVTSIGDAPASVEATPVVATPVAAEAAVEGSLTMTVTSVSEPIISKVSQLPYVVVTGTASGTEMKAILRDNMIAQYAALTVAGQRITMVGEANKNGFRPASISAATGDESVIEAPAPKAVKAAKPAKVAKPAARKTASKGRATYQFRVKVKSATTLKTKTGDDFTLGKVDVIHRTTGEVLRANVNTVAFGGAHTNVSPFMRRGKTLELSAHYNGEDLVIDGRRAGAAKAAAARMAA